MKCCFMVLALVFHHLWIQGQQPDFASFKLHLSQLEDSEDFTGAKAYLRSHADEFPGQWFYLSKELIYFQEKMGQYEENLKLFEEGHQKGFFYFLHPALPRFEPYLAYPEFERLIQTDRKLYEEALARSSTRYRVELPPGFRPDRRYPLLLIFHGGNSNLQQVREHWHEGYLDQNFIRLYLQSYRHFDSESYTWRSGDPRSDSDLKEIFREVLNTYPVDTGRVAAAGISAGANYAIGMALRGVLPVTGFIAFCPGLPSEMTSGSITPGLRSDLRGYLVGGEYDFYREYQQQMLLLFDEMGLEYQYILEGGMYHQYPENENFHIREGLRFIFPECDIKPTKQT